MDETKFTGAFTFPDPADPSKRQFGMVAGTVDTSGDESVAIILRTEGTTITWEIVDAGIRINAPARLIRAMLPVIAKCLTELDAV